MDIGSARCAYFSEEVIALAFVDVMAFEMVVWIVNAQMQLDDTIATGLRRIQRIYIDTTFPQICSVEVERQVILTYLFCNNLTHGRHDNDSSNIDTIVSIMCTRVEIVSAAFSNVISVLPCIRSLTFTDGNLFNELIRVVNEEIQTIDAVACELRIEVESVFIRSIQGIYTYRVTCMVEVFPYVRSVHISDMNS